MFSAKFLLILLIFCNFFIWEVRALSSLREKNSVSATFLFKNYVFGSVFVDFAYFGSCFHLMGHGVFIASRTKIRFRRLFCLTFTCSAPFLLILLILGYFFIWEDRALSSLREKNPVSATFWSKKSLFSSKSLYCYFKVIIFY